MKLWICASAFLVLAGCTAVSTVPSHSRTATPAIELGGGAPTGSSVPIHALAIGIGNSANGGTFAARYAGKDTLEICAFNDGGDFTFNGSGSASFIGTSIENGSIRQQFPNCAWAGSATLVSTVHPRNSITMGLTLRHIFRNTPCYPYGYHVMFVVTGGTGRFALATGSGTVKFTCNANHLYTDSWAGTIAF